MGRVWVKSCLHLYNVILIRVRLISSKKILKKHHYETFVFYRKTVDSATYKYVLRRTRSSVLGLSIAVGK